MNKNNLKNDIYLYNSLSKSIELLNTLKPDVINLYMCGITVYDFCHLGHARSQIMIDGLIRCMKHIGYKVTFVRNITDIDDKIISRAKQMDISIQNLVEKMIMHMHEDFNKLNLLKPTFEPRATEYIKDIITMIDQLLTSSHAYYKDKDIYFDVSKFEHYGCLSRQKSENLRNADRHILGINNKENKQDFILWKSAKLDEPQFESSFGPGRPGWHIECSAMSCSILGKCFDIHAGGLDLLFPHHENEIAQSFAANKVSPANYWLHIGLLTINNKKMSKSLDNYLLIRDILKDYTGNVLRLMFFKTHYRKPMNFTYDLLSANKVSMDKILNIIETHDCQDNDTVIDEVIMNRFISFLSYDFNTPAAISVMFFAIKEINKQSNNHNLINTLKLMLDILGFDIISARKPLQISCETINALLEERSIEKRRKNYARADEIRKYLSKFGIIIEDGLEASTWKQK